MSNLQLAIIAAIHVEPKYRFTGDERTAAARMEKRGWLRRSLGKTYSVTRNGERAYQKANGAIRG